MRILRCAAEYATNGHLFEDKGKLLLYGTSILADGDALTNMA